MVEHPSAAVKGTRRSLINIGPLLASTVQLVDGVTLGWGLRPCEDRVTVIVCVDGVGQVTGAKPATVSRGCLVVLDTDGPFTIVAIGETVLVLLCIERSVFECRFGAPASLAGRVVEPAGMATLPLRFLADLPSAVPDGLDTVQQLELGEVALDLLHLALGLRNAPDDGARAAHIDRAIAYMEEHLAEPDLGPAQIASGAAVSVRYLHELFRDTGETVRQRTIRRRLERCVADLLDPAQTDRTISAIAAGWGFKTAAHFSRCFVDRYGETPSEYRRLRCAG